MVSPHTQQAHRVLAMQATHRNEFIQDTPTFLPVARGITCCQRTEQLISCCHTDLPHRRSPSTLLGSKLREATGQPPGAFPARQCARLTVVKKCPRDPAPIRPSAPAEATGASRS